jgi:hypothetical protein
MSVTKLKTLKMKVIPLKRKKEGILLLKRERNEYERTDRSGASVSRTA